MSTDEQPGAVGVFPVSSRLGNDIRGLEHRAVVAFQIGFLKRHLIAILRKLFFYPLGTKLVGIAVHGARPEVALLLAEGIGGIGRKLYLDGNRSTVVLRLFRSLTSEEQRYTYYDIYCNHECKVTNTFSNFQEKVSSVLSGGVEFGLATLFRDLDNEAPRVSRFYARSVIIA